jgi:hypothetical protein
MTAFRAASLLVAHGAMVGLAACSDATPETRASGGTAGAAQVTNGAPAGMTSGAGGTSTAGAPGVAGSAGDATGGGGTLGGAGTATGGAPAGAGGAGSAGSVDSAGSAGSAGNASGKVEHRFVSGISGGGPIAIVAADGHIEWQHQVAGEANDVWALANGHVAFAHKDGATELSADEQVVWSYDAPAGSEIHGCQPLPGGGFLIGEAHDGGLSFLRELDAAGKLQKSIPVTAPSNLSAHEQFREVRKTPQGTYLVTYLGLAHAREVDDTGKLLRELPCGSFVAVRLPSGNTLVACGDDHRVIEVDAQNNVVWQVTEKEIPGNQLGFAAGVQRLPNGNTIICNWPGHGGLPPNQPQAFELTADKRVVWELKDPALKLVSNLEVLDPEARVDGVVLR